MMGSSDGPLSQQEPLMAELSFAQDIKPLFRDKDRNSMRGRFDLLRSGTMPCDGKWSPDHIDLFSRWIVGGMAE
jgi:hypothetical protein